MNKDQQINMNVCNGNEPNEDTDEQMSLYDYNGEHNGNDYYVIYLIIYLIHQYMLLH